MITDKLKIHYKTQK